MTPQIAPDAATSAQQALRMGTLDHPHLIVEHRSARKERQPR